MSDRGICRENRAASSWTKASPRCTAFGSRGRAHVDVGSTLERVPGGCGRVLEHSGLSMQALATEHRVE